MGGHGSGGARSRSGPPADPYALKRQRDGKEWTQLPAVGRLGEPPEWPDETDEPNPDELTMWRRVWMSPQAVIWEADQVHDLVAFYVRTYLEAMKPRAGAQARTFVKQMAEQLYLTSPSLAQGKYVVQGSAEARAIDAATTAGHPVGGAKKSGSARTRLTVVEPVDLEDEDQEDVVTAEVPDDPPPF